MYEKLVPFVLALVLVGQGCLSPAPAPQEEQKPVEEPMMENTENQENTLMEGESMMEDGVVTFEVSGKNFSYNPNKITVKKGQKVRIKFKNTGGFHDWVVDEFDAHTIRVNEGEEATVEFTPDQAGTFEFYCSVGQHRANGMVGVLEVVEDTSMMEIDATLEGEIKP